MTRCVAILGVAMGEFNSSECVVRPTFDELVSSAKLAKFLGWVLPPNVDCGRVVEIWYEGHPKEKVIPPQAAFLDWCRNHVQELCRPNLAAERLKVDPKYKFEGGTHPDVYIKTSTCHVVIEAKWTEPNITAHTTWRKEGERDQLIRHMDALLCPDGLPVYGLFLIDAHRKISKVDIERRFRDKIYIQTSIPHRVDDGSWKKIWNGFCGVYTWQELRRTLRLKEPCCVE